MIIFLLYYFRGWGRNPSINFVHFWGDLKTQKYCSEINWPLVNSNGKRKVDKNMNCDLIIILYPIVKCKSVMNLALVPEGNFFYFQNFLEYIRKKHILHNRPKIGDIKQAFLWLLKCSFSFRCSIKYLKLGPRPRRRPSKYQVQYLVEFKASYPYLRMNDM